MDGRKIKGAVLSAAAASLLALGYGYGVSHANDARTAAPGVAATARWRTRRERNG